MYSSASVWETFLNSVQTPAMHTVGETTPSTASSEQQGHTWADKKFRELELRGIVHYEFVPTGQTVNQVYYLEVLKRLREKS